MPQYPFYPGTPGSTSGFFKTSIRPYLDPTRSSLNAQNITGYTHGTSVHVNTLNVISNTCYLYYDTFKYLL